MKKFIFILRILGAFSFVLFMVLFLLGYTKVSNGFIIATLFIFGLVMALHLSQYYHNYFLRRRSEE